MRDRQRAQGHLLGRSGELGAVRERLARGRRGRCEVVLIEGEPGIGKSRFLAEVLADPAGLRLFHADAEELERTRPFGPVADSLGCRLTSADPLRAEISRLLDEGAAEFRIVERFGELLERTALEGPLLVSVDDLQWADPSTVTTLRFAARHLGDVPVMFVLAYRPIPRGDELERFVDTSIRDGALHVTLGPLDDIAVFELVEDLVGRPPGPRLRTLVASAAGNPFYVTELIDALTADGRLQTTDGEVDAESESVPVAFRGAVVRYLRFLGEPRLSLLRWAAVLGSRFSPVDLATVSGTTIDALLPVLEEAAGAGILIHADDRLVFRHDLLRDALYEDMGIAVRQSLHRDAGRALAAARAAPLEVAYHVVRGPAVNDDVAVEWLLAAAHHAIHLDTKAELLESALERLAAGDRRTAEIGVKAIRVLGQSGRVADAEALADRLKVHLDTDDRALLSAALAGAYAQITDPLGVLRHCDAVRHDTSLPPPVRAGLLANEATALLVAGRVAAAEAAAHRAIDAGVRHGAAGATHAGRGTLSLCALANGRGRDAAALAAETAKSWQSDWGKIILQTALLNEDRLTEADGLLRTSHDRVVETGHLVVQPGLHGDSALALLLAGRLDDALAQAEAALAAEAALSLAEQAHVPVITAIARGVIARIAVHRGSVAAAKAALGPARPAPGLGVDWFEWARALTLEAEGDQAGARDALSSAWDSPHRYIITWISVAPELVRLHLAAGEREMAASVATAVESGATGSDAPSAAGAALRCRALVERDPARIRQAVAAYQLGPRVLETARTREDAASLLADPEAEEQLRAALEAYETAGATGDATRVRAALRKRGVHIGVRGKRQRHTTGWDSLTPTEHKIVALAAEGLTSRQIADRLYVSTFTVGSHLRHVYQKLGINSRVQLTAEAIRQQAHEN